MKTYTELKSEREEKTGALITDCKMFFAFNAEQFKEGSEKLPEDSGAIVSIGMGGYMPKANVHKFDKGNAALKAWFEAEIKANKLEEEEIRYELANHEAWYTWDITDTMAVLGDRYTETEVWEVFNMYADQYE